MKNPGMNPGFFYFGKAEMNIKKQPLTAAGWKGKVVRREGILNEKVS